MDTQTFDEELEAVSQYEELDKDVKKRVAEIKGRWDNGIIPSGSEQEWIDQLVKKHGAVFVCHYLHNGNCVHKELRDPVKGALPCKRLANQKECEHFMKGEIK